MAGIPDHVIEDVKLRADIVDVVGEYLPLKKSGANYRALCPFHEEKTPSFNVNADRQIFHCFGCGEGGNSFTFVMKMDGISFPEAVRYLAKKYGVEVPETSDQKRDSTLEKLYDAMESAKSFYHKKLKAEGKDSSIKKYLEKRGITDELVEKFSLGYAPDDWEELKNGIKSKKTDIKTMETAGLIKISSRGNHIDRFRDRLIFPITNAGGKVIAFGGRMIGEGKQEGAKYLNSPETPIYHKSNVLYGYHLARQSARKEGFIIIVEGYMDVIALHNAGIENCVAISGTAMTGKQAELIKRLCDKAILLLDSDTAGETATMKSGAILLDYALKTRVLTLPDAKDPDEFLATRNGDDLSKLCTSAPTFLTYAIDKTVEKSDVSDIEGKIEAIARVAPLIRKVKNEVESRHYVTLLSEKTGTDEEAVAKELNRRRKPAPQARKITQQETPAKKHKKSAETVAERVLVRILLDHPEYLDGIASPLKRSDFTDSVYSELFGLILEGREKNVKSAADIVNLAESEEARVALTSITMDRGLVDEENMELAIKDSIDLLTRRPNDMERLKEELKTALISGTREDFLDISKKLKQRLK